MFPYTESANVITTSTKSDIITDVQKCTLEDKKGRINYESFVKFLGLNFRFHKELDLLLGSGNIKLPNSTAIFNMGSATDCPSWKLGLCQACKNGKRFCYALKAETEMRKFVLPFRRRQEKLWKKITAEEFALSFLIINSLKVVKYKALRLNESGDFWGQECVDKAGKIARILKPYGVRVYCYTARSDLDYSHVEVLKVTGSGWTNEYVRGEFRLIYNKKERPRGYGICIMNCKVCDRCLRGGMKTCVLKH